MDPVAGALIGSAVIGAGASIYGGSKASKAAKAAVAEQARQFNEIKAMLEGIGIPSADAQRIMLTDPRLMGELIPELQGQAEELSSSFQDLAVDPRLKEAQLQALSAIQERSTGLTPEDMINLRKAREDVAGGLRSQDANILQNMEQRGIGGSGLEVMMRQAGGQNAMRQAAEEADRLASLQYQARMQALQDAGQMAGSMRTQEFGEESAKAQNLDAMAKFNLANRMNVEQSNIASKNQAQAANLAQRQALELARAGNRSQEETHNKALAQQEFQNKMQKAGVLAGVQTNASNAAMNVAQNQAANTQGMWSGIGQTVAGLGQAYANYSKPIASGSDAVVAKPATTDNGELLNSYWKENPYKK